MQYSPVFSKGLSVTKIGVVFRKARFGDRVKCPRCCSVHCYEFKKGQWRCRRCWYKFSLTSGTFLGKLKAPLALWHDLVWCFVLKLPAHRAGRLLKLASYKTALRSYQIIRRAILQASRVSLRKFTGTCEVDESFFGGDFKNLRKKVRAKLRLAGQAKRGRGARYRKQPVFGIYQRNGNVYLEPIPDATARILQEAVQRRVRLGAKVFSDTWTGYTGLVGIGYVHRTVAHEEGEYVTGKIHINGIEGFWGLSKTDLLIYKGIRKENWLFYLKELEFRYNQRQFTFDQQTEHIIEMLSTEIRPEVA